MIPRRVFLVFLAFERFWIFGDGVPGAASEECPEPCALVQNCAVAWETLKKVRLDDAESGTMRSSFCGYNSAGNLKVCCHTVKSRIHPNLSLLPSECGINDGDRVYGGNVTGLVELPWMALVSMNTKDGPRFMCGGSVISSRYVLTAGHCVANRKVLGVRVGEYDLSEARDCHGSHTIVCSEPAQDIPKERVILHPKHSSSGASSWANDIALIRLANNIDFKPRNARPVCLPTTEAEQQRCLKGLSAVIAGWGATENGTGSDVLLKANIPVFSKEECVSFYESDKVPRWSRTNTATFLCAGMRHVDVCQGDSGGPLLVSGQHGGYTRYIQYGVASFGETRCGGGRPTLYSDVVLHMPWILDNLEP